MGILDEEQWQMHLLVRASARKRNAESARECDAGTGWHHKATGPLRDASGSVTYRLSPAAGAGWLLAGAELHGGSELMGERLKLGFLKTISKILESRTLVCYRL
jgi:hypothetical protein